MSASTWEQRQQAEAAAGVPSGLTMETFAAVGSCWRLSPLENLRQMPGAGPCLGHNLDPGVQHAELVGLVC